MKDVVTVPVPPAALTPSRRRRASVGWLYLAPALAFLGVFFIAPLMTTFWSSLHLKTGAAVQADLTLANYRAFFDQPALWQAMSNSIELTALTILFALPLAYAMAASIVFAVPQRWHLPVLILTILPFWTSYVVRTYAWLLVLGDRGIVNAAFLGIGVIEEPLRLANDRVGILVVFVHYFLMIMTLTIFVTLRRIPRNLIRAALDLGATPTRAFLTVILPLSVPGMATGVFLTIVLAIGDYVTPQIIGGGSELTMPQAIMLQIGRLSNLPLAAALSFILTLLIVVVIALFSPFLGTRRRT